MAREINDMLDSTFADVVEDVKHEVVQVERPDEPFDNVIYVITCRYTGATGLIYFRRILSLFPSIIRYKVIYKFDMNGREMNMFFRAFDKFMIDAQRCEYIIYFDINEGSIVEVRELMNALGKVIKECKFNPASINLEKETSEYDNSYGLYKTLVFKNPKHIFREDYTRRHNTSLKIKYEHAPLYEYTTLNIYTI